jgi:hypothetical protein
MFKHVPKQPETPGIHRSLFLVYLAGQPLCIVRSHNKLDAISYAAEHHLTFGLALKAKTQASTSVKDWNKVMRSVYQEYATLPLLLVATLRPKIEYFTDAS